MTKTKPLIAYPHLRERWCSAGDRIVIVHTSLGAIKGTGPIPSKSQQTLYQAAKLKLDMDAAVKLVLNAVNPKKIDLIVSLVAEERDPPLIVFPHPSFDTGAAAATNAIPHAFGAYLAAITGCNLDEQIIQVARVGRTELSLFARFLWQPKFEGDVAPGRAYVIADDTYTNGGTLAALRCHIIRNGGTPAVLHRVVSSAWPRPELCRCSGHYPCA